MIEAGYLYPKSKSPLELKYERLRGMCSGAWENVRYIPVDNGIQQHGEHGGIWFVLCVYRYTNATSGILVYDMRYANTVYNRHHQSFATPGCVYRVRACVRYIIILLYYYNIIILLYYYIIILLYLYIPNIPSIPSIHNIPNIPNIPNISNNGNIEL